MQCIIILPYAQTYVLMFLCSYVLNKQQFSVFTFNRTCVRLNLGCTRCETLKQALRFARWHELSVLLIPFKFTNISKNIVY